MVVTSRQLTFPLIFTRLLRQTEHLHTLRHSGASARPPAAPQVFLSRRKSGVKILRPRLRVGPLRNMDACRCECVGRDAEARLVWLSVSQTRSRVKVHSVKSRFASRLPPHEETL